MQTITEPARQTPVAHETDVLVVGAGPGGSAAAEATLERFLNLGVSLTYAGRGGSSSPATGSYARHKIEQDYLVRRAIGEV